MRFMMIIRATNDSESGHPSRREVIEEMRKYKEQLARAGVLLASEDLLPSSSGSRLSYPVPGDEAVMTEGPFYETRELVAGFTLIEVKSREEAIEWAFRMPDPHGFGEGEIELRQVKDFPDYFL
ncbi:YciI family protein [Paenibacillus sedimenti]|uniref:YciI family protein n=1 Tax=Paenibacillus sedimenti TaxID=2770274 RepID=A0A926KTN9_9BACL|nr:YciI family protein [Paenibacillus sedimenti]MBD0382043.1 YciI family protein [Paenibacillus sedimenti]